MVIDFFIFPVEDFRFSKTHDEEPKHGKRYFKRGLTVVFNIENS